VSNKLLTAWSVLCRPRPRMAASGPTTFVRLDQLHGCPSPELAETSAIRFHLRSGNARSTGSDSRSIEGGHYHCGFASGATILELQQSRFQMFVFPASPPLPAISSRPVLPSPDW